jgi:hypothetical protein
MLSTPRPKGQKVDHTTDKTILLRIHPMPARCTPREPATPRPKGRRTTARNRMNVLFTMSNNPQAKPGQATPKGNAHAGPQARKTSHQTAPAGTTPQPAKPDWWSQTGSNRRPHACKARALPAELWPRRRYAPHPIGPAKGKPAQRPGCTRRLHQTAANGGPGKT